MNKLNVTQKKEALQNGMKTYNFPESYFVKPDEIKGQKFAIASNGDRGSVFIHTNFMTYDEFNAFLFGYHYSQISKFY